jgi:hypothetical protein
MSKSNWNNGLIEWTEDHTVYLSIVFSWQLAEAYQRAAWYKALGYHVRAGGPAVTLNPNYLTDVAKIGGQVNALPYHNPDATFTSRGCIRHCPFCAVPRIEGDLVELDDWEPKPVVCDNNLLACSHAHFDQVIDRLKPVRRVDFNQGLDARLLTKYHAQRLTELDLARVRLAWDDIHLESAFMAAYEKLRNTGVPKKKIRVYVLFGFKDTPANALYRFQTIKNLGLWPNPMRYQPLQAKKRNDYIAPHWTEHELRRYSRYWSRQRWLAAVPFEEYTQRTPAHANA